jgi:hypothetical protein
MRGCWAAPARRPDAQKPFPLNRFFPDSPKKPRFPTGSIEPAGVGRYTFRPFCSGFFKVFAGRRTNFPDPGQTPAGEFENTHG